MIGPDDNQSDAESSLKVLIVTAICEVIAVCMISTNISRFSEDRSNVYVGVMAMACGIMIIWTMVFFGVVYESEFLTCFACLLWITIALWWLFFVKGCITPTRCPEGLWLVENGDRLEREEESTIEYYYHEYHKPLPDRKNGVMELEPNDQFDEPVTVVPQVPLTQFTFELNTYWKSMAGAFIYLTSFASTLIFFGWTTLLLRKLIRELNAVAAQKIKCTNAATGVV